MTSMIRLMCGSGARPGRYPNEPDFGTLLGEGATVGQVGFDKWTHDGFSSYFAAMQGTVRDDQTGYLVLATAMGRAGITRTGSRFDPDDLVRHVRLHPSGQLEIGFETPTDERPDPLLLVRGAVATEGALKVEEPAATCRMPARCGVQSRKDAMCACRVRRWKWRSAAEAAASEAISQDRGRCKQASLRMDGK